MKPLAFVGALLGAAVGAAVWAFVAWKFDFESAYVAWGIGLLAGFLSHAFGGRGVSNGIMSAAVALLGIFAGKVLAFRLVADDVLGDASGIITWSDSIRLAFEGLEVLDIAFAVFGLLSAYQLGARTDGTPAAE